MLVKIKTIAACLYQVERKWWLTKVRPQSFSGQKYTYQIKLLVLVFISKFMTGGNVSGTCSLVMRLLGKMHVAYLSGWGMFIEDMSSRTNVRWVFFSRENICQGRAYWWCVFWRCVLEYKEVDWNKVF